MAIYCINFNGFHIITDQSEIITEHKDNKNITSLIFGTEEDAKNKLLELQTLFYNMEISKIHVVKVNDDGVDKIWTPVDIYSDAVETTETYTIQNNIDNESISTTGDKLYNEIDAIKKEMLNTFNLNNYKILDKLPDIVKRKNIQNNQPTSDGTTTI